MQQELKYKNELIFQITLRDFKSLALGKLVAHARKQK